MHGFLAFAVRLYAHRCFEFQRWLDGGIASNEKDWVPAQGSFVVVS